MYLKFIENIIFLNLRTFASNLRKILSEYGLKYLKFGPHFYDDFLRFGEKIVYFFIYFFFGERFLGKDLVECKESAEGVLEIDMMLGYDMNERALFSCQLLRGTR